MDSAKCLIYKEKKTLFSAFILSGRGSKIGFAATALIRFRSPAYWRLPFVCGRTTFVVSSLQPPQNAKKKPPFRRLFLAGAVRLATLSLHSFAFAHRHTGVCLSFVVEPLSREFSSTAPKCKKKPPFRTAVFGRGSKIRTHDTRFWRPMLYQLSYTPIKSLSLI